MKLLDKDGKPTAEIINQEKLAETDTVYNFEVQDFHTYHIGEIGVWVHNADCCGLDVTESVTVSGGRAIDRGGSYEESIRGLYGNTTQTQRRYTTIVDGKRVNGIADDVAVIDGKKTAIEAKYVDNWSESIRNPSSNNGDRPWAVQEQNKMIEQAKKYSSGFQGGVIYHTNSTDLAQYYSKLFNDNGISNFKFIITPTN